MDSQKPQTSPIIYILVGVAIVLIIQKLSSNNQSQLSNSTYEQTNPTIDPYKDCINWQDAALYDGKSACVIGKVIFVEREVDEDVQETVWTAHFSMSEDAFFIMSWGDSLDKWQDKCVVIRETLIDRNKQEPDFRNKAPGMVNSDLSTDYVISDAPARLCQ